MSLILKSFFSTRRGVIVPTTVTQSFHEILTLYIKLGIEKTDYRNTALKADMNGDIPLKTAVIYFLANFYLKQGIRSQYVMVDFICIGLLEL